MKSYLVKFTDSDVNMELVHASGHKLIHNERVLSFHDDHGNEVFATDIHNVAWWKTEDVPAQSPAPRTIGAVTSGPLFNAAADSATRAGAGSIGDQVAADLGRVTTG